VHWAQSVTALLLELHLIMHWAQFITAIPLEYVLGRLMFLAPSGW